MITLEAFSDLLGALYAAPLYEQQWGRFLELLCQATNSRGAYLLCADARLGLSIRAQGGGLFELPMLETYREQYAANDPYRLPAIRKGRTGLLDCDELMPREAFLQSPLYRDILQPAGLSYPGLMLFTCDVRRFEAISLWRSEDQGPVSPEVTRLLKLLYPHVEAALRVRQALGVADEQMQQTKAIADASVTPVLLLGAKAHVLQMNRAAEIFLRSSRALIVHEDRLVAHPPSQDRALTNMVQRILEGGDGLSNRSLLLQRPGHSDPLVLMASPARYGPQKRPAALLIITDPARTSTPADDLLRDLYSLTAAEIEIANGILTGYSPEEIACLRKVTIGTVRSQLKRIFLKTATTRQSDLIRLLVSLPKVEKA